MNAASRKCAAPVAPAPPQIARRQQRRDPTIMTTTSASSTPKVTVSAVEFEAPGVRIRFGPRARSRENDGCPRNAAASSGRPPGCRPTSGPRHALSEAAREVHRGSAGWKLDWSSPAAEKRASNRPAKVPRLASNAAPGCARNRSAAPRIELEAHHPALLGRRIVPVNDPWRHQVVMQHTAVRGRRMRAVSESRAASGFAARTWLHWRRPAGC